MSYFVADDDGYDPPPQGSKPCVLPLHHSSLLTHLLTQRSHIDRAVQRLIGERLWHWQALAIHARVANTFSALTNNGTNRRKTSSHKQTFWCYQTVLALGLIGGRMQNQTASEESSRPYLPGLGSHSMPGLVIAVRRSVRERRRKRTGQFFWALPMVARRISLVCPNVKEVKKEESLFIRRTLPHLAC